MDYLRLQMKPNTQSLQDGIPGLTKIYENVQNLLEQSFTSPAHYNNRMLIVEEMEMVSYHYRRMMAKLFSRYMKESSKSTKPPPPGVHPFTVDPDIKNLEEAVRPTVFYCWARHVSCHRSVIYLLH